MIICLIYLLAMKLQNLVAMRFFAFFGQHAVAFFVFPWLVVFKTLAVTGMLRTFEIWESVAFTILVLSLFSLIVLEKNQLVKRLPRRVSSIFGTPK
jgi:hypothetical protein